MKKIFLDSYIFLEVFLNGSKQVRAEHILSKIKNGEFHCIISAFALLEIKYHILRKLGHENAERAAYILRTYPNIGIVDMDEPIAELAANIRFKYYDKNKRPMSFGDAVHIATAIHTECDMLISGEEDFRNLDEIKTEIY